MIKTYRPIIATTPNAITYSILFTSLFLQKKLVGSRAEPRLPLFNTARTGMTPAVAPATMLRGFEMYVVLWGNRNMMRIASWRIYMRGKNAPFIQPFFHC